MPDSRRHPLLIWDTVPASALDRLEPDARVLLDWSGLAPETRGDALAIHTLSGWTVAVDYRHQGHDRLLLVGRDWCGETRHLPVDVSLVRVERPQK